MKRKVFVFLISMSLMLIVSQNLGGNGGKIMVPNEYSKLGVRTSSSSLGLDMWQLREFKVWATIDPEIDFLVAEDSVLRVNSLTGSREGVGYVFTLARRSDLDGNKIQVHWNAFYTYDDSRDLGVLSVYVFDGAFDRMDMNDYFEEGLGRQPMLDYTHVECTHYPGPLGAPAGWLGWRTDTSDIMDLASWVSDYVTILIRTDDYWSSQLVAGDFDWIKILDANDNEVGSFDFSGEVQMEVTGTYHDYGLLYPSTSTSIYVDPSVTQVGVDESFSVDVKVANVTDLYSWEFKLYYQKAILNTTQVVEGSFLKSAGYTLWMDNSNLNYNATHGLIYVGASLTGEIPGVNGTGILATILFRTLSSGISTLDLQDTIAMSSAISSIPHTAFGGFVAVAVELHDVAVLSVMPNKNVVGNSDLCAMRVNVTVQNQGEFAESFNVEAYYNTSLIGVQTVTDLASGINITLEFIWHPIGVSKGNYTIGASADVVPNETDVDDNTLYDGIVAVSLAGDFAGSGLWPDGIVNIVDATQIGLTWGSIRGEPRYKPNCDIDDDGVINIKDVAILGRNWGKVDP